MRITLATLPRLLQPILRPPRTACSRPSYHRGPLRSFTTSPRPRAKPLPPRPTIPECDITEQFLKGSGPGGQKINKTSSAVQLKHLPTGLVVKSQATRSRTENRKIARRILAEKLEEMEKGAESRVQLKAEVKRRRKASQGKKARRKYRKLEEGKGVVDEGDGDEEEDEDAGEGEDEREDMDPGEAAEDQGDSSDVTKDKR